MVTNSHPEETLLRLGWDANLNPREAFLLALLEQGNICYGAEEYGAGEVTAATMAQWLRHGRCLSVILPHKSFSLNLCVGRRDGRLRVKVLRQETSQIWWSLGFSTGQPGIEAGNGGYQTLSEEMLEEAQQKQANLWLGAISHPAYV